MYTCDMSSISYEYWKTNLGTTAVYAIFITQDMIAVLIMECTLTYGLATFHFILYLVKAYSFNI